MAQQQFCLKWNNYQSNMSEVFQNMLINENMVDVTIACEGTHLKAHKMVLAACSPFFQSLFLGNPCQHPIVILKDVRFIDLRAIIDFMYRGEVNVSQDQLSALLKTAETLKVKGLAEVTEKQARGQPQLQHALFGAPPGSGRKKRKRNKKAGQHKESGESSESDEENGLSTKHRNMDGRSLQRISGQRIIQNSCIEKEITTDQLEPSRILEQSMATAEVGGAENGQEGVLVASDVQALADADEGMQDRITYNLNRILLCIAMRGHHVTLFEDGMGLSGQGDGTILAMPGTSGGQPSQGNIY